VGYGPNHDLPLLSVEDVEQLTPDERAAAFDERIIWDGHALPEQARAMIAAAPPAPA